MCEANVEEAGAVKICTSIGTHLTERVVFEALQQKKKWKLAGIIST